MSDSNYFAADAEYEFERERLTLLEQELDPLTIRHLNALGGPGAPGPHGANGVAQGWKCLEVGAGHGSMARWLAQRVGPEGKVLAVDMDLRFIGESDSPNLTIRRYDILADDQDALGGPGGHGGIEEGQYDLAHCRALLMHLKDPKKALEHMAAALRPGGWLLIEEPDYGLYWFANPEHPAAEFISNFMRKALAAIEKSGMMDLYLGRRVRCLVEGLGFVDVESEGVASIRRGGEAKTRFALMTFQQVARRLVNARIVTKDDYARYLRLTDDPSYYATGPAFFSAWGRRPG